MRHSLAIQFLGYAASILIAISMMMSSIIRLRIINLFGALAFTIYGLIIGAYPVVLLDSIIVIIDLYYLHEMFTAKEYFKLLEVRQTSEYLRFFLDYYQDDINKYIPGFVYTSSTDQSAIFVLRNMIPAGLFIFEQTNDAEIFIKLDFVIPGYRDFKIGKFVYQQNAVLFKSRGIKKIYSQSSNKDHKEYLRHMGFAEVDAQRNLFCLSL